MMVKVGLVCAELEKRNQARVWVRVLLLIPLVGVQRGRLKAVLF